MTAGKRQRGVDRGKDGEEKKHGEHEFFFQSTGPRSRGSRSPLSPVPRVCPSAHFVSLTHSLSHTQSMSWAACQLSVKTSECKIVSEWEREDKLRDCFTC